MFSMKIGEGTNRYVQFDGMIHYYKRGWMSNKWNIVYAKLWSDSTLEWFSSKGSDKPLGTVYLGNLVPFICIGPQIRKVPSKKPKVEATWDKNFLMAVASDQKAATVHWFYFDNGNNLRKWIAEITKTLPRLAHPSSYRRREYGNDNFDNNQRNYGNSLVTRCFYLLFMILGMNQSPFPRMTPTPNNIGEGINISLNSSSSSHPSQRRRNSFDDLFDDAMINFGVGNSFFDLDSNDSDSDSDSDFDNRHHHTDEINVHGFGDGAGMRGDTPRVSQIGDATIINFRS
uniref:PH domain-containing protein n=1 Tax=Panagrolaimus superbus TaxID=310955 RepID=A0A914ZAF0_9BILA